MRRCKSWRPVSATVPNMGVPGVDKKNWTACTERVPRGVVRCPQCTELLASHIDPRVRRALASEQGLPQPILDRLCNDTDITVTAVAKLSQKAKETTR